MAGVPGARNALLSSRLLKRHLHGAGHRAAMPLVCLVLGALALWNFLHTRGGGPAVYPSVSVLDSAYVWPQCANMTRLPYRPANSPFGNFESFGIHGFVFVSAYRLNSLSFAVLGLTPPALRSQWGRFQEACLWVSFSGPQLTEGRLEYRFLEDEEGGDEELDYVVVVIQCTLTHANVIGAGGALLINIMGLDELMVYREDPGSRELNPQSLLPTTLTMCSTVLSIREVGKLHAQRSLDHLMYMRFFGAQRFVLYDGGGYGPDLRAAVAPFSKAGVLEMVDFTALRRSRVDADAVAVNDCALRLRFKSEWVVMLSYEDYPTLGDSEKLSRLLKVNAGRPWMSVGTVVWDTSMCIHTEDDALLLVEKMVFRRKKPYCTNSTADPVRCLGKTGMRRVIFDPRKVGLLSPHSVVFPTMQGLDLNTTTMRINKFVGLAAPAALTCEFPVGTKHSSPRWERDLSISKLVNQGKLSGQMAAP